MIPKRMKERLAQELETQTAELEKKQREFQEALEIYKAALKKEIKEELAEEYGLERKDEKEGE